MELQPKSTRRRRDVLQLIEGTISFLLPRELNRSIALCAIDLLRDLDRLFAARLLVRLLQSAMQARPRELRGLVRANQGE